MKKFNFKAFTGSVNLVFNSFLVLEVMLMFSSEA